MYEVIVILKALTEVAGVGMLGQGLLWVLAGAKREQNSMYTFFKVVTTPVMKATRFITPRVVLDQHIGLVAFFLVTLLWLALTALKIKFVLDQSAAAS